MSVTIAANPSTQDPKQQKQTAKEAIAANVQALIEQLEQGHSETLTAYLTAMGRFHNYSFGNILEIARQEAGRNPRCRVPRMEAVWPPCKEGRARYSHPCSGYRRSPQKERRSRGRQPAPKEGGTGWLPFRLCL